MALPTITVLSRIEILEDRTLQVRLTTYMVHEGERIEETGRHHRFAFQPGDAIPDDMDTSVQQIATLLWTPSVIKAHKIAMQKSQALLDTLLNPGKVTGKASVSTKPKPKRKAGTRVRR